MASWFPGVLAYLLQGTGMCLVPCPTPTPQQAAQAALAPVVGRWASGQCSCYVEPISDASRCSCWRSKMGAREEYSDPGMIRYQYAPQQVMNKPSACNRWVKMPPHPWTKFIHEEWRIQNSQYLQGFYAYLVTILLHIVLSIIMYVQKRLIHHQILAGR